ncbi:MAG: pyridoxal phosphate-dependent aminotransferase [Acetatifactor sp.]|nr:pyridoxal phosphate-dependent aminotransferase [Acetatifactor sp.]
MERNLRFDEYVDRRNTKSLKYDFAAERGATKEALPMWVADMDFKTSSYVIDALKQTAEHGIFGYSERDNSFTEALVDWEKRRHGYDIKPEWIINTPGIVFALATAVKAFTKEGDAVIIQQPVYYPFSEVIVDNDRRLISSDLVLNEETHSYEIDFADFEKKVKEEKVKLFFLCNPHNPTGRVWTKEELIKLGDICVENGVIIVSDEIHRDFVFEGKHIEFTTLKKEYEWQTIVCTSPSKTFNLAGLQISNIYIPNPVLRKKVKYQIAASGYSQVGVMGLVACEAAYRNGDEWLEGVLKYLKENREYLEKRITGEFPKIKLIRQEGTYLSWLDFREYGQSGAELKKRLLTEAGLWFDGGEMFGKTGDGFERVNIACPRKTLEEALNRLKRL